MIGATIEHHDEAVLNTSPRVAKSSISQGKLEALGNLSSIKTKEADINELKPISIHMVEFKWPASPSIPLKKKVVRQKITPTISFHPFASLVDTEITVQSFRKLFDQSIHFSGKNDAEINI